MKNSFHDQYSAYENGLIREFHGHRFFVGFSNLKKSVVIGFLLQLGHLSAEFVKWYERAKQGFALEAAKEVIHHILRDEIPADLPTHQDNRIDDLVLMGIPKERALNEHASETTAHTLRAIYKLVGFPQEEYDLRVLITLRIFGEILVGETYGYIVGALPRFDIKAEQSTFYAPHFFHDKKEGAGEGHTGEFDALLASLICDKRTLAIAKDAARKAFELRLRFHDQFRHAGAD